jgi:TPP-dependent pyruvate/acetoin dehydrogenase alpha subunit
MIAPEVSGEELQSLLETKWLTRAFEERASKIYARGKIDGLLHLGMGLESVASGATSVMWRDGTSSAGTENLRAPLSVAPISIP